MAKRTPSLGSAGPATSDDVKSMLGNVDESKLLAIMELRPTIADVEQALVWLGGDADIYDAEPALRGIASQIVSILTADEEEISEAR
jgi:hypothetical protein